MRKEKILIVDDDPEMLKALQLMLEEEGFGVVSAKNGLQALKKLKLQHIHLIVADIAMPGLNGYQLFNQIIQNPQWMAIPFIFLTARGMDSDINFGKELGVDDYLLKPVESRDFLATVHGKLKRSAQLAGIRGKPVETDLQEEEFLDFAVLKISPAQHRVWMKDVIIPLSTREFKLLLYLAKNRNTVVSHQSLIEETHGLQTDVQDASQLLRPLIRSLRRKLGYPSGSMGCIENIRGVGYQFISPVSVGPS